MRITTLLFLIVSLQSLQSQVSPFIHVDQFGYRVNATKVAVLSDPQIGFNSAANFSASGTVQLIDMNTGAISYQAAPTSWNSGNTHDQSGDKGWWFDFSSVTTPGTYCVLDPNSSEKSAPFRIHANPYQEVLNAAVRMFYYNRCNDSKDSPYAQSGWTDGMNFENPLQDVECRFYLEPNNSAKEKDLSGGWFDAGDYNKYVTFAHSPVHQLLSTYEEYPTLYGDDWNWPESGNGLADLLDEVKWELDWLAKMVNSDGSTHIKMGSVNFSDNASAPPSANTDPRYYGPICSSASISVASMFAHAAAVYTGINGYNSYADDLETTAISCWNYFKSKFDANSLEENCDDGTIKAGDADRSISEQLDLAVIAAVYLYKVTGSTAYRTFVDQQAYSTEPLASGYWSPYRTELCEALLLYSQLPGATVSVALDIRNSAINRLSSDAQQYFSFSDDDLYRAFAPSSIYHWGSNLPKAAIGNLCHLFIRFGIQPASNATLSTKAEEQLHYFHGVNPLGIVYLSNMYGFGGDRCADEIYHTWFYDGTDWDHAQNSLYGPAPGFIPGGPNQYSSVDFSPPSGQPAQKSYLDFNNGFPDNSWEITEPAIYYQAIYIRLLAHHVNNQQLTNDMNVHAINQSLEILPDPSATSYSVAGHLSKYTIELLNEAEVVLNEMTPLGSQVVIPLATLPAGAFFVRVKSKSDANLSFQTQLE